MSKIESVKKRDGSIVDFTPQRITNAIYRAAVAVGGRDKRTSEKLAEKVVHTLEAQTPEGETPTVEQIQDIVETVLIEANIPQVAKSYIIYRARHEAMRDTKKLMLDINTTMDGYLSQSDWRVNENANVNFSLGGLILHNSGTITANYWLKNIYPEDVATAHREADFHIHDLSMFSGYCAGWSLRQLIKEGLGGVPDKITSKPAKHLKVVVFPQPLGPSRKKSSPGSILRFISFNIFLSGVYDFVIFSNVSLIMIRMSCFVIDPITNNLLLTERLFNSMIEQYIKNLRDFEQGPAQLHLKLSEG